MREVLFQLSRRLVTICVGAPLALLGFTFAVHAVDAQGGSVTPISSALCDDMKLHNVMKPGFPVGCARLSLVTFSYVDFEGRLHSDGEIVVMDAVAEHVLQIFTKLRDLRFPIAKARLMNHYNGNDSASTADNNTSSFNARKSTGGSSLSMHAYGLAIDLNPVRNPYAVRRASGLIYRPPPGARYANRLRDDLEKNLRSGMAESVIAVFADHGFVVWGGKWRNPIDYQHFQAPRGMAERLAGLPPAQAQAAFRQHVESYRACRKSVGPSLALSKCIADR